MIYFWGGKKKFYASWKFLIYTFFASLFLLASLISMMLINEEVTGRLSASLLDFYLLDFSFMEKQFFSTQSLLFLGMTFAFAVKTPLVPFHTWLPLAHVEAPTPASVYLAALLLKLGAYGWIRFVLPLTPEAASFYSPALLFLACLSLLHASALAFTQKDVKKLAAYSSVAHMAYVFLGLFAFNLIGLKGAYYQSLTHGISSAALFFLIGMIYKRSGTRDISQYGGLASFMPYFTGFFFIVVLSSIALPLTAGFVSEFLVLMGSFMSKKPWVIIGVLGAILSAIYMLKAFGRIFLGKASPLSQELKDIKISEWLVLSPLAFLLFFMGLFPNLFFSFSNTSLSRLLEKKGNYYLSIHVGSFKDRSPNKKEEKKSPETKEGL